MYVPLTHIVRQSDSVLTLPAFNDHRAKAVVDIPQGRRQWHRSLPNMSQQFRYRPRPTTRHRTNRFRLLHQLRRKRLPRTNARSQRRILRPPPMPYKRPIQRPPNSKWNNPRRERLIRTIHPGQILRKRIRARPLPETMARPTSAHNPARVYRAWIPELPQVAGRRVKQASHVAGALYATAAAHAGT